MQTQENNPAWMQVAEVELIYKNKVKPSERPTIKSSEQTAQLLLQIWNETNIELFESFKVILLNQANRVLGIYHVSNGGITGTVADVRIILAVAIKSNAVSIILAHNHPSGNLQPSRADEDMTAKIKNAAAYHEIKVLDHLIITKEGYYSFADMGFL